MREQVAVIGAGMTGLAVASELARTGRAVTVFEKEAAPGGLAGAIRLSGMELDRHYHHIFPGHAELLETIRRLGLGGDIVFRHAPMAYFSDGRLWPFTSAMDLLRFRPLPLPSRLRLGLAALSMRRPGDWRRFDPLTAADWLTRRCGANAFRLVWEPLLRNKFADAAGEISAAWLWDRLRSRSSARLGYLRGGFGALFTGLQREIEGHGGEVRMRVPVSAIERDGSSRSPWRVNGEPFAAVVATLALPQLLPLLPDLPADLQAQLASIRYAHSIDIILQLEEPLSPYYWINVGDRAVPFAVVVEHTNWMPAGDYENRHIAYLSRYVTGGDDPAWSATDDLLLDECQLHLQRVFPGFHRSQVIAAEIVRDAHTQPLFVAGYAGRRPPFSLDPRGLFLVNTSQFYPHSRCLNTSFVLAGQFTAHFTGGRPGLL